MEAAADEERPLIPHLHSQDEYSLYASDGTVDSNNQPALKRTTGNWRACFLILGTKFVECFVFFGVAKNLVTYLTAELHESNVDAAKSVSIWIGTCFVTPVIGAFLADTYWGRYWTIVIFLSIYIVGMLTMTASASLPLLMDSLHNSGISHVLVYLGLYLVALGGGGIKPCTSALGADQFDGADSGERVTKASFFNWYYFSVNIGSLLSGTVLVWVQDNVGWGVGFLIPTVLMVFGLATFIAGRRVYRYKKLKGSPLKSVSQVLVAAARNCNLELPEDCSALHEVPSPTPTKPNRRIQHTSQFRFFDKAAILVTSCDEKGVAVSENPWRLCTVSQVEELKMLLRMFPVWASMVLFFTVTAQMSSTFIEQGAAMDNRVGSFAVPPASRVPGDLRRHQRHGLHPRLRRRTRAAGPPRHREGPGPVTAAADRRRPCSLRGGGGRGTEAGPPADRHADEHHVAGAGVRRARRGGGVRFHRHPRVLLRRVAGRHEEPRNRACRPHCCCWELPQFGGAGRRRSCYGAWREARVDPGRPEGGGTWGWTISSG